MQTKKSTGILAFGILSIACGLFLLYTFVLYLLDKPWTALHFDFGGILFFVSFFIFPPGLVGGFIVSGIGVLKGKPWSRYLLLITTGFGLWGLVNRLILLGPCTEEFFYISRFLIGGLFLWFFNRKSVRTVFPYRRGLKVLTIVWIVVISLEFSGAGVFWFSHRKYYIYILNLQHAVYESRDESFYSRDYFRSPFPLKYSLAIPKGFTPYLIDKDDIGGMDIVLARPHKGSITMNDQTFLQKMYSSAKVFGYRNPYRYYEKSHLERFGLFFFMLGNIEPLGTRRIEKAQIDGLRAFIRKGKFKNQWSYFYFFQGNEAIGRAHITGPGFTREQMDHIISSLKPQDKPLKSAREFFQEGKALLDHKDFEEAKFSLVSALCLDWENPHYHYYLGRTFFETEDWFGAKQHLEKAMSFQPDYPEAQKLLREVKVRKDGERSDK